MDYNQQKDSKDTENENGKCSEYGCPNMNKFFATFRKVWSTFGIHCPVRGLLAQTMVHFAHFQVLPTFKFRAGGQLITLSLCKSMLSNFSIPPSFTLAPIGSGPRYMIRVTLFCTLRESENTRTCENCTRNAQRAKTCDKILYLGPLPRPQDSNPLFYCSAPVLHST